MKAKQPWFPRESSTGDGSLRNGERHGERSGCSTGASLASSQSRHTSLRKLPVFGCFTEPAASHGDSGTLTEKGQQHASRASSTPPASRIPILVVPEVVPEESAGPSSTQSEHVLAAPGHGPRTTDSPAVARTDEQSVEITGDETREEKIAEDLRNVTGLPAESAARNPFPPCSSSEHLERRVFVPPPRRPGPHDHRVPPQRNTWLDPFVGSGTTQTLIPLNTGQRSSAPRVVLSRWESSSVQTGVEGPRRSASRRNTRSRRRRCRRARSSRSCSPALPPRIPLVDLVDSHHARYHQATPTRAAPVLSTTATQQDRNHDAPEAFTTTANDDKSTASKMSSYTMTYSPTSPSLLTLSPMVTVPIAPPPTPAQDIPLQTSSRDVVDEVDMNIDEILSALPIGIPIPPGEQPCALFPVRRAPTPPSSSLYGRSRRSSAASSNPFVSDGEEGEEEGGVALRHNPFIPIMYPGRGEVPRRLFEPQNKLLAALVRDSYPCDDDGDDGDDETEEVGEDQDFRDDELVTVARDGVASYCQPASLCRAHRACMPCERGKRAGEIDTTGPLRQRRVTWQIDTKEQEARWVDVQARGLSARANKFGAVGQQVTSRTVPPPVCVVQDHEKAVWTPRGWDVVLRSGLRTAVQEGAPWTTKNQFGC
ncbi:uncharacterized protein PV07_06628 [Cladophialophora immunda]|uniref:Uncharacterized protein n=1 Tax=Cladophialophora immunda TaxID=569365 RepID=A0A0D2C8L5_9EURO|nr:uncharacterized protein PV07_06628 [Cladophialophora immunda]KIW26825.1 hypothetical protein PV07_06628 [Cladophialophora immunda]